MSIRFIGLLLCAAGMALIMPMHAYAKKGAIVATGENFPDANNAKGNHAAKKTVKGSKSNAGDSMGGVEQGPPMGGIISFGRRRF